MSEAAPDTAALPRDGQEHRLHPLSWLFVLLAQLKQFILPLLVLLFAGRGDRNDLWGLLAISWIDNIVRPLVISNATSIPFLLVLFGVLGGVVAFGLVGLFVGPVILAVLMAVWREWMAEKAAGA